MSDCFWGQAYIVSFHIVFDIMANHWLIVFLGYELTFFLNIKVACQQIVLMPTYKLYPDDFWDVGEALVVQNFIDIVSALLAELLFSPELLGLLVFGLQFV